jgi:hypothetical protein
VDDRAVSNSEQVRLAVEEVLASGTLSRSEQLRSFLRYVCERTLAGDGKEINEYSVAVEALGKPSDFSPAEDSSVRRSAYELRQKLHKYYELENPDAALRIELPKGSYNPKFVEAGPKPAADAAGVKPASYIAKPAASRAVWILAAALVVSLGISAALTVAALRGGTRVSPVVREAWSSMTATGDRVLISVGTTLHLVVRPYMAVVAEGFPKYPAPPELYAMFRQHRPLPEGVELFMHPVDNSVQLGHSQTVVIAATTLSLMGTPYQILPERSASAPALRGRNVILIADPQNSNSAAERLEATPLTLDFDAAVQDVVVRERAGAHTMWAGKRGQDKRYTDVYGLITVLPAEGEAAGPHRTLIFSGITSVGTNGAAEFFSKPETLNVLRAKFVAEGYSGFPAAYQVVVRCRSNDTLLLSTDYVTHRVIAK